MRTKTIQWRSEGLYGHLSIWRRTKVFIVLPLLSTENSDWLYQRPSQGPSNKLT